MSLTMHLNSGWRYFEGTFNIKGIEEQNLTALDLNSTLSEFFSISFKCQLGNFGLNKIYHSSAVDLSIFRKQAKIQLFLSDLIENSFLAINRRSIEILLLDFIDFGKFSGKIFGEVLFYS